eukprot:26050_1
MAAFLRSPFMKRGMRSRVLRAPLINSKACCGWLDNLKALSCLSSQLFSLFLMLSHLVYLGGASDPQISNISFKNAHFIDPMADFRIDFKIPLSDSYQEVEIAAITPYYGGMKINVKLNSTHTGGCTLGMVTKNRNRSLYVGVTSGHCYPNKSYPDVFDNQMIKIGTYTSGTCNSSADCAVFVFDDQSAAASAYMMIGSHNLSTFSATTHNYGNMDNIVFKLGSASGETRGFLLLRDTSLPTSCNGVPNQNNSMVGLVMAERNGIFSKNADSGSYVYNSSYGLIYGMVSGGIPGSGTSTVIRYQNIVKYCDVEDIININATRPPTSDPTTFNPSQYPGSSGIEIGWEVIAGPIITSCVCLLCFAIVCRKEIKRKLGQLRNDGFYTHTLSDNDDMIAGDGTNLIYDCGARIILL